MSKKPKALRVALLSAGPSLNGSFDGTGDYDLLIGVNTAATKFKVDYWSCCDQSRFADIVPKGNPALYTHPEQYHRMKTMNAAKLKGHHVILWDATFEACSVPARWMQWSAPSALVLAYSLGAKVIDCYGVDMAGNADVTGEVMARERQQSRWDSELRLWRKIVEHLEGKGIIIKRIGSPTLPPAPDDRDRFVGELKDYLRRHEREGESCTGQVACDHEPIEDGHEIHTLGFSATIRAWTEGISCGQGWTAFRLFRQFVHLSKSQGDQRFQRDVVLAQLIEEMDKPPQTTGKTAGISEPTHSADFTSVNWYGTHYTFSKGNQAESIKALWGEWKNGGHGLGQETIREKIDSNADRFELRKAFRVRAGGKLTTHPAWNTMIVSDKPGQYRLKSPG